MRWELFALHLPNPDRVQADDAVLSELSKGLSGGDILNICVNAIHAGSTDPNPERWMGTQRILEREIAKAKKANLRPESKFRGLLVSSLQNYFHIMRAQSI